MSTPIKKILIIRFSSIGDLVLTTPVYRCLKAKYPNALIHVVVKKKLSGILASNPNIDKLILFEGDLFSLAMSLRQEEYDYVIDLHNNLRSSLLKLLLQVKSSSVKKMNWNKWRMVNWKNKIAIPHIVTRYLEACRELEVFYDGQGLDHFTDTQSQNWLQSVFLAGHSDKTITVFSVGGQFDTKRLPVDKWKRLAENIDGAIHIIGGKEDESLGQELFKSFPDKMINWTGKLTINQSAEIIKIANKVYTNDTGMMHIAAAFNKDIEVFWGNTVPSFGMTPFYSDNKKGLVVHHEVLELSCRPCSKIGFKSCPKGHFNCMRLQEID